MFERFTDRSRRVLVVAQEEDRLLNSPSIGSGHLLLGLIQDDGGIAGEVLAELGVSLTEARERVREAGGTAGAGPRGSPPFSPEAKRVLELALRESMKLHSEYIGPEHLLLGLIVDEDGQGAQALVGLGVDLPQIRQSVIGKLEGDRTAESRMIVNVGAPRRPRGPVEARVVSCSFCGLRPPESGELIAGDNAFICEHCVRRWWSLLGRFSRTHQGPSPMSPVNQVTPDEPPSDPVRARDEIAAVFARFGDVSDDGTAALGVEKGGNLGWAVSAARASNPQFSEAEVLFTVVDIMFVDADHATVWYSIVLNGQAVVNRNRGDAVLHDGKWLISRMTFSQIMAMSGIIVPPE